MRKKFYIFTAAMFASLCLLTTANQQKTSALSASSFQAGNIISDSVFTNSNAMSANDVQTFLSSQVPSCDTNGTKLSSHPNGSGGYYTRAQWGAIYDSSNNTTIAAAPYVCLKSYVENPSTGQNNLHNPGASISGGMSAAQIIVDRAKKYDLNPEVIITTLQKEQGIVTDDWPWVNEYQEAMGYMCPDTPQGCNSAYAGFYKQVDNAAWQFRHYLDFQGDPGSFWIGNYKVPYSPSCSGPAINIQNAATAALYDYTPYQPDNNVITSTNPTGSASGPGGAVSGDACGAYGNRNFWWYFNTWFGPSIGDLVQAVGDKTVYMLSGTTAYPIRDVNVLHDFSALGPVRQTTLGEINSYTGGPTLTRFVGSSSSSALYLVNANIKLHFNSCGSVADYGYSCSGNIVRLSDSSLDKLVNGPAVTSFLKSNASASVYYISGGKKRPIPSWHDVIAFNKSPRINSLNSAFVNSYATSSTAFGPGSLLKTPNSPTIYVVKDINNLYKISSMAYPKDLGLGSSYRILGDSHYTVPSTLENKLLCGSSDKIGTNGKNYTVASTDNVMKASRYAGGYQDGGSICNNISTSSSKLSYIKPVHSNTIYWINASGQKQAFGSWSAYLSAQQADGNPGYSTVSDFFANTLQTAP